MIGMLLLLINFLLCTIHFEVAFNSFGRVSPLLWYDGQSGLVSSISRVDIWNLLHFNASARPTLQSFPLPSFLFLITCSLSLRSCNLFLDALLLSSKPMFFCGHFILLFFLDESSSFS